MILSPSPLQPHGKVLGTGKHIVSEFPGGPVVKTLSFHCREQVSGHGTKIPPAVQPLKKKKKNIYIYIYLSSAVVGALWYN